MTNVYPAASRVCHLIDDKWRQVRKCSVMARTGFGTQHHLEMVGAPVLAAAEAAARLAHKIKRARPRPLRGATLRVGPDTPLWNKLAATAAKLLRKRGDKAHLARVLGV